MKNTELYIDQLNIWPKSGKHILAQYDNESVIVYQAYRPDIAEFALKNQYFGGGFSYTRMSWIKTNFLWMMYRSGWNTKEGQERTLQIHLDRAYFNNILRNAYPSSCPEGADFAEWKKLVTQTNVRLQWDPDHDPLGNKEPRKAIQLGLRNEFLAPFKGAGINRILDITDFVKDQHRILMTKGINLLLTPVERSYEVDLEIKNNLKM